MRGEEGQGEGGEGGVVNGKGQAGVRVLEEVKGESWTVSVWKWDAGGRGPVVVVETDREAG